MSNLVDNIIYKKLKKIDSKFIPKIDTLYEHVYSVLPKMNNIFDNYTEHGIDHSLRVLNYMSQLIYDVEKLSELELTMIIYVALLHDIGMVVGESEKNSLTDNGINEFGMKYSVIKEEYNNEKRSLQEYYRPIHGLRAIKYIENMQQQELFCMQGAPGISFAEDIAKICMSHTESSDWIRANLRKSIIKEECEANPQYIATLLRLGDILDIDEKRTPHHIFRLFELDSYSNLEWKQHFDIDNTKKIFTDEKTGQKYVEFRGSSNEAEVHRKLLNYIDWINNELEFSSNLCSTFSDEKYSLFIKEKVINRIETNGFSISDFRLTLDYKAVTGLLMGEKIYGDNLSFDEFCDQFESDRYNGTKVEKIEKIVSHKRNLDSVLLINEKYRVGYDIYSWRYNKNDKIQKIYNKNVYLSKMSVVIPYISNMINLGNITINLCHREVIPNLARDNVDENYLLESIGFAIGKGIHLYLLENEMLAEE